MGESSSSSWSSSSVSFGKYENDVICWERWSSFPPTNNNKYLDEVGKCSTPGSVAQKAAFFEAHYKKIAAIKKAELADDLLAHPHPSSSSSSSSSTSTSDHHQVQHQISTDEDECVHDTGGNHHSHSNHLQQAQAEAPVLVNNQILQHNKPPPQYLVPSQSAIPIINTNADNLQQQQQQQQQQEAVLVNRQSMKQHFQLEPPHTPKPKPQNVAPKVNPTKVENNLLAMNNIIIKPPSMMPKSPSTSLSKPKPTTTPPMTTSTSSFNNPIASSSSSSKTRNPSVSKTTRIAPMSLHLSMSMTSVHSDTASSSVTSSTRRSLFMEQMGDRDIVKRAFKTFLTRYNQSPSSDGTSGDTKQLPTKGSGQKASTSMASQKGNERSKKAAEKINHARGQIGPTWKSVSSGSLKGVGVDERWLKTTPTSVVLRSNERAERRKEFFKNLEEKSNAREAERTQLSSKSKEAKDAEIKKLRQNPTFKAKPTPSFYRAQGLSKSTSEKEAIKNGTTRRHDSHR